MDEWMTGWEKGRKKSGKEGRKKRGKEGREGRKAGDIAQCRSSVQLPLLLPKKKKKKPVYLRDKYIALLIWLWVFEFSFHYCHLLVSYLL